VDGLIASSREAAKKYSPPSKPWVKSWNMYNPKGEKSLAP
jgi:hypothetical protein